jgi:hypothetical protein
MNRSHPRKSGKWHERNVEWVWEVLLVITVSPAIVYGILSLHQLPVV